MARYNHGSLIVRGSIREGRMATENSFRLLWDRARSGDRDAQAELYLEFGPHLRRIIRLKLRDLKLEWAVEPDDIFDSFFIRICRWPHKDHDPRCVAFHELLRTSTA